MSGLLSFSTSLAQARGQAPLSSDGWYSIPLRSVRIEYITPAKKPAAKEEKSQKRRNIHKNLHMFSGPTTRTSRNLCRSSSYFSSSWALFFFIHSGIKTNLRAGRQEQQRPFCLKKCYRLRPRLYNIATAQPHPIQPNPTKASQDELARGPSHHASTTHHPPTHHQTAPTCL